MKTYKLFRFTFVIIFLLMVSVNHAQLSGNYTVGGSNPDFATLPDVTSALQTQGVSGPVTFNLRAGTYETNGGTERALEIEGIPGASGDNIVTFQADANSGATVENTILSRSIGVYGYGDIAHCKLGFLTFRNLTFQYSDTTFTGIGGGGLDFRPANPLNDFIVDLDGEDRDAEFPFFGADEEDGTAPEIFTPAGLTQTNDDALHFTSADLDGDGDADILVGSWGGDAGVSMHSTYLPLKILKKLAQMGSTI